MQCVKAWEEQVIIPTYKIGAPDRNPMFLEKRVYQGSSGVVYPHPVIDKVFDEKEDKTYQALFLENDFLKVMILPELGGRIQMAYDKTNDYHFIYYNHVIKPALVGLTGPWISGGIEFNWPQHHRPSTFEPVDYTLTENADGSQTVWVSEIEIMFHTKGMAGITLYPDKAYIEITGKLYNRTAFPQTFLWWANPAVQVDEHYQSVFPPDVHAVYDHGKRDVSSFPIATGVYYKVDYAPGTDISRYQHIPVPTSYMAVNSAFDFMGGYHHAKRAGILHVADHHISPGKKQWTWGSGEFGQTWDKQLTDNDGPYFELMTGVYTDNQPDFSWIMPNEERVFQQYFMPYKDIGYVKNANKEAAVNLEITGSRAVVSLYVTAEQQGLQLLLTDGKDVLLDEKINLRPATAYAREIILPENTPEEKLSVALRDQHGKLLIRYQPVLPAGKTIPDPAKAIGEPQQIDTQEELYLAGLHLEQYRHATYAPLPYYQEALRRDPDDIRSNNAVGRWYLRHGQFAWAAPYFHKAILRLTRHNPNPYDGEPHYNLGLCLGYQERWDDAYDAFYKACWNAAWQDNAYLQLALLDCRREHLEKALDHIAHSLARNGHGMKARHLKTMLLRKSSLYTVAEQWARETLHLDQFDFGSRYELCQLLEETGRSDEAAGEKKTLLSLTRGWAHSFIDIAIDYAQAGCYTEAITWLRWIEKSPYSMIHYYLGYYYAKVGSLAEADEALRKAASLSAERVFPNRLEDILVLQFVLQQRPDDYKASYVLGNLWYAKRQYAEALHCWEKAAALCGDFSTVHRNLGIAYYNKFNEKDKALQCYEKAFACDLGDARVLFELDQLYRCRNKPLKERLAFLQNHVRLVYERDDLYIEYVTLYNLLGQYEMAGKLLGERNFHPWEGGEGKVSRQYVHTKVCLAQRALQEKKTDDAIRLLQEAQHYPANLGEGKLFGAQENDVFYWLGCAYAQKEDEQQAWTWWQKAAVGLSEPAPAIYYNDQPPEKICYQGLALRKLGREKEARLRFENLLHYGEAHLQDQIKIDFFAVSLPDLMVFDTDLNERNRIHCHYLMGLGDLGLHEQAEAEQHFRTVLKMDVAHMGAIVHTQLIQAIG